MSRLARFSLPGRRTGGPLGCTPSIDTGQGQVRVKDILKRGFFEGLFLL
jgi:hypothetical protein